MQATITVSSPIERSPRVQQVEGLFDMQPAETSAQTWQVNLPIDSRPWNIGLIVGPSGCGKSTIARRLWPDQFLKQEAWTGESAWLPGHSILDSFPEPMSAKEVVHLLSSVGFSSPPAWLRPYLALSTGQRFRTDLARLLACSQDLAILDEFTSVVDRTVAQTASHALAKTVRARGQKFIAITCHEDVEPWLNPDWVYRPDVNQFTWRLLQRRPNINLEIRRVHRSAWQLFAPHHYLSADLSPTALCWAATWSGRPVAFSAWINFYGARTPTYREHRTVTLPDFQGVGIGHAVSTLIASMWKGLGNRATSTTTHPAFVAARLRDKTNWILTRAPSLASRARRMKHATTRLTAGFAYIGPAMKPADAHNLRGR